MSLLLLFGQPTGATPQTWTGTNGTITITGTSGSFTAGAITWTGTNGTALISGTSGTFTPGPRQWTGTNGTATITGTSGRFIYPQTWNATNGTLTITGTSGAFGGGTAPSNGTPGGGRYHPLRFTPPPADEYDENLALILALV